MREAGDCCCVVVEEEEEGWRLISVSPCNSNVWLFLKAQCVKQISHYVHDIILHSSSQKQKRMSVKSIIKFQTIPDI